MRAGSWGLAAECLGTKQTNRVEAVAVRLEAIAIRLEAIASKLEAIAISLKPRESDLALKEGCYKAVNLIGNAGPHWFIMFCCLSYICQRRLSCPL